ncbi:c-type cytochrome [Synechococcus sp. FACHB-909]|uniref:c-type cytochrome n=1 Tax=Synechococcus sp. FACHB-909 TaxID=2692863 RepID=UPI00336A95A7
MALLLLLGLIVPPAALGFPGAALALAAAPPEPVALENALEADVTDGSVLRLSVLDAGSSLFGAHCAGCHLQGGNIIRRGKTLKMAALERNGITSPEAIAAIAAGGVGQMGGYAQSLGEGGPEAVAAWVWQQALDGWPRA